ncbi:MAG: hypothetical protein QOH46_957 [Solirubrobacteraceae bacterium]|nr:hypothetical protein [Solirubrobacteraceae bacterium]
MRSRPDQDVRASQVATVHRMLDARRDKGAGGTRGLAAANKKLRSVGTPLEQAIDELLHDGRHVSVLELGFGWGAALA